MQVSPTVVTPEEAISVEELFSRGLRRFDQRQYTLAAGDLEAAAAGLAEPERALLAWHRAGVARDESGDLAAAAQDFARALGETPRGVLDERSALARDARMRLIRLLVFLERWSEAGEQARRAHELFQNLNAIESIAVKGALALDALRIGDLNSASSAIEAARTIIEDRKFDASAQLQRDVAVVYFALGELRRLRAAELRFVPLPRDFAEQLERRCQLLLDAQSAYSMAMRAYDAHWSIMAGYRVSQLYEELHYDLMQVLTVVELPRNDDRQLFEAALRLRYTVLLEKATKSLDHTLALAARVDEHSKWLDLAREASGKLRRALAEEQSALGHVPYSREHILRALERLGQERRSSQPPAKGVAAEPNRNP